MIWGVLHHEAAPGGSRRPAICAAAPGGPHACPRALPGCVPRAFHSSCHLLTFKVQDQFWPNRSKASLARHLWGHMVALPYSHVGESRLQQRKEKEHIVFV